MCLSHVLYSLLLTNVAYTCTCSLSLVSSISSFSHLVELVVEVVPSVEGPVTTGERFNLSCRLDSGEDAPSVKWKLVGMAISTAQTSDTRSTCT